MASLREFELGGGDVDLQMVPGYYSAESEEQYAVHVCHPCSPDIPYVPYSSGL